MRTIPFSYTDGFNETYVSGKTRADNLVFNIFYHAASKLAATPDDYSGLYQSAENEFQGSSTFPAVTLTDVNTTPAGTTPTDTDSDGVRDTAQAKTTITGTITGGKDTINSTLIFVDNVKYTAPVVDGVFSKEVPLLTGDNDVVILATDENTFSNWAGFLRDTIRCTASPASLTVTLTWDQDQSDVDLHVLEPGTGGRHIYYNSMGSGGSNPYLDIDNTHGYGPEHYYAIEGSTIPGSTNLYGTYQIRVHYYDDKSDIGNTPNSHLALKREIPCIQKRPDRSRILDRRITQRRTLNTKQLRLRRLPDQWSSMVRHLVHNLQCTQPIRLRRTATTTKRLYLNPKSPLWGSLFLF